MLQGLCRPPLVSFRVRRPTIDQAVVATCKHHACLRLRIHEQAEILRQCTCEQVVIAWWEYSAETAEAVVGHLTCPWATVAGSSRSWRRSFTNQVTRLKFSSHSSERKQMPSMYMHCSRSNWPMGECLSAIVSPLSIHLQFYAVFASKFRFSSILLRCASGDVVCMFVLTILSCHIFSNI
jgi:hypothetical protein